MEIIARKTKTIVWLSVAGIVLGVVLLLLRSWYLGISLLVICGILILLYLRQPKVMIAYDGEKLVFPQGRYAPSEILNVTYDRGRRRALKERSGSLKVYLSDGKVFVFHFVADVEEVHNRLMELRLRTGQNVRGEEVV